MIRRQIKDTPELSDRQIAKMLGVSNSTIGIIRRDLIEDGQVCESHTSIGLDGKEYKRHRETEAANKFVLLTTDDSTQSASV